jgi:hypothetical protein
VEQLNEQLVIRLIREEYNDQLKQLKGDIESALGKDASTQAQKKSDSSSSTNKAKLLDIELLSPGLKIKSKDVGILYTIKSVSTSNVVLLTPELKPINIPAVEFEKNYERA